MKNKYNLFIESTEDFPKKGVVYWDFTPLLKDPKMFKKVIADIKNHFKAKEITKIAAIEAKGFTIATALAYELQKPLVLIRKPGLIPGKIKSRKFEKEYGLGEYQVRTDTFESTDNVLLIYDILAGPGATKAAIELIESSGANVIGCAYVIELQYLHGRKALKSYDLFSLVKIKEKK